MFTTESEAWEAVADTLAAIKAMPPALYVSVGGYQECRGLCAVIGCLWRDAVIATDVYQAMQARIRAAVARESYASPHPHGYLAYPGEWKPRVTIARRFARESAR